ncbi:TNFR/NGFR cysteine-rich region [Branchiostoma belcheri]|nr:TNFR/NGFR cysteine-rich region [Branchiostoma belcheri]
MSQVYFHGFLVVLAILACWRCTRCHSQVHEEEKTPCRKYQDRVCQCMQGYYIPRWSVSEVCYRHMKCPPGEGVDKKAASGAVSREQEKQTRYVDPVHMEHSQTKGLHGRSAGDGLINKIHFVSNYHIPSKVKTTASLFCVAQVYHVNVHPLAQLHRGINNPHTINIRFHLYPQVFHSIKQSTSGADGGSGSPDSSDAVHSVEVHEANQMNTEDEHSPLMSALGSHPEEAAASPSEDPDISEKELAKLAKTIGPGWEAASIQFLDITRAQLETYWEEYCKVNGTCPTGGSITTYRRAIHCVSTTSALTHEYLAHLRALTHDVSQVPPKMETPKMEMYVCTAEGAAAIECDDQHHLVNGLCCIKCLPGFYKDKDCDAESPTKCLQCPGGTYTEFLNYIEECLVCEHCSEDHGIEEKRPCLPTQNRKCRCMDGFFLEPSLILGQNADMCHRHQECQPGEGVVERGTRTSDTVCTPCAVGTFSDQGSRTQKCEDWTDCESLGLKLIIPGTTDRDTVCGYEFLPSTMSSAKTTQTPPPSSSYATVSMTSVKDAGSAWQTTSEENGHATTSGNKHTDHRGSNHTVATVMGGPGITYRNSAYSPVTDSGDTVTVTNPYLLCQFQLDHQIRMQAKAPHKTCDETTEYSHRQLCCKKCPAGTYLKNDCDQDHSTPSCTQCPPGTYTRYNNHLRGCLRCHIPCNPSFGFVEVIDCQPHHNRQCRCKEGMYKRHELCVLDQKPCPPGQGVVKKGSIRTHPVCEDCPPGTFSSKPSLTKACRAWRNCAALGLDTKRAGTATRNAKCGGPLVLQQTEPVTAAIPVTTIKTSEAANNTTATTASPVVDVTLPTPKPPQTTLDVESTTGDVTINKVQGGPAREQLLDPQDAQGSSEEGAVMSGQASAEDQGQLNMSQAAGDVPVGTVQLHAASPEANQSLQPVDATMIRMQQGTTVVDARRQLVIYSQSTTIQQNNDFGSPNNVQLGQGNTINVATENCEAQAEQSDEE